MALNKAAAYGMYSQDVALNDVVHTLNQAGFDNEDICMMLCSHSSHRQPGAGRQPVQFGMRSQCGHCRAYRVAFWFRRRADSRLSVSSSSRRLSSTL